MTTTDVPLPFAELVEPTYVKGSTIQERFDAFHAANPWVADALEALAADWLEHGHQRVGVKAHWPRSSAGSTAGRLGVVSGRSTTHSSPATPACCSTVTPSGRARSRPGR